MELLSALGLNFFSMALIMAGILSGIIIGLFFPRHTKDETLYFDLESHTITDIPMIEETSFLGFLKETDDMPAKWFFKLAPCFSTKRGRKAFKRFLLMVGNLFTVYPNSEKKELGVQTYIEGVLTKEEYTALSQDTKKKLEETTVLFSVEPKAPKEPFHPDASEDDYYRDAEQRLFEIWAKASKAAEKIPFIDKLPWIGVGAAIILILCLAVGWIKIA